MIQMLRRFGVALAVAQRIASPTALQHYERYEHAVRVRRAILKTRPGR